MYAKCGSINVWRMFNKTPSQNVIIWTAMMLGVCAIWVRVEGVGTILKNARGGCATKLCIFVVVYFMCKHGGA
jgi:hypothetical protein